MLNGLENTALAGIRILELTKGPSGGYAGRLLAESGALITKVLGESQAPSAFRDAGKYVTSEPVEKLMCESWDMIFWDSHSSHQMNQLLTRKLSNHPDPCCVGVRMDFPSGVDEDEEHTLQALGGWSQLTGNPYMPPLVVGGYPASYLVGAHAATAGLFALLEKKWTGRGRLVEIDALTIVVSALEGAYSTYLATGLSRNRPGNRHHALAPMAILPSSDGWVFVGAPVDEKWELLERWAELPDLPEWSNMESRRANCVALEEAIAKWTGNVTREELFLMGQTFRLPFAKVQSLEEVRRCPQLADRNFWTTSESGEPRMRLPWKMNPGPADASVSNGSAPFGLTSWRGLRILDLTGMWSGPYCTRLFADMGVEVIKVEAPHRPDGIRSNQGVSAPFFRELNRNKLGIQLDLRLDSDRQTFLNLVAVSDVLIENFSPRVMSNFGLHPEELWKHRPNLTLVSLSAFGQTGPYRDFVGYGPTLEAMSGLASLTHDSNGNPFLPGFSLSDLGAGIHGAFALLASLFLQERLEMGLWIDQSQYETACQFIGDDLIEGIAPSKPKNPVPIRGIVELAKDRQITQMSIPGGPPILGMPWNSEGWEVSLCPPPELGEHTEEVCRRMQKDF